MSVKTPSSLTSNLDIVEGTVLGKCYKVEAFLGEGGFGFVTKCLNTQTNKAVAIKVNKSHPEILKQAKLEMFILEQLRCLDPDSCNIVKWNGFFLDKERICLNFELLDQSLYDYIQDRNNQGLSISELRPVLYQLANALSHLSSMGIVHADLKPDNVMVVDRHQSPIKVKVIDFGLACPVSAVVPGVCVQTLWYRAPEVMLHVPFNQAIDMWSLGLIAVELAIGWPLYPGHMDFDVLRFIIHTQGQPPDCVLDCGFGTDYYFVQENFGNQRWRFKSEEQFQYETGFQPQETRYLKLNCLDDLEQLMKMRTGKHSGQNLLVSLIKEMLHLDANQRITPLEVLQHPFFDPCLSQSSSRDPCIDMENTEDQSLVLSQQPSHWQSKSQHSIDYSVQNPVGLPEQTPSNMSVNTPSSLHSDLDIVEGTVLGKCYKVEAFLGEGGFGFVTKCLNTQTNKAVAIKVNKSHPEILQQAKLEMFILEQLRCLDPDSCNIVKWNGFFLDRGHICLNFELLDQSLYDYIQDRNNQGLPISELRPILYQLANALSHLSSIGIVHADLKPGNVMVVDRHQSPIKVKVIDFGLACPVSAVVPGVCVQTIWYRAPEVMLHAPFNQAIDMWSLGLIAAELAIGWPLYPGHMDFDVFRFIIHTQGQPPDCVLDCGFDTDYFFIQENFGNQRWRFKSEEQFQYETGLQPQETRYVKLRCLDDLEQLMKMRTGKHSGQDLLVSLIKEMLHLNANQRITPLEVLQHPFFDPCLSQSSSRDPCIDMENTEDQSLALSQKPSQHITPLKVIQDIFLTPSLSQSSSRDPCIDMENTEDQSLALSQQPSQHITPLKVIQDIFLTPSLSQTSSRDPCIDMENTEGQSLVRSRQPSLWESESQHSIVCSVQNPVGLPVQTPSNMSINTPSSLPSNLDIVEGTVLGKCYKVEAFLGEGCFGFVTKCLNTQTNRAVAIKVNKSDPEILQQAKFEIFILKQLQCLDPDTCNIVKWNGFFFDRGRICLNFELLDQSLYDYIQDRNNQGLPISELRPILYQLANALSHLSSIGIVHTDLKPDNVMVVDRDQSPIKVKLIDFGLACPVSAVVPGVSVQALWYRAPEVMLQVPFNQAIDMWAVGLIAVEMATGWPLYPGDTEFDVLRFIIHTQGQPPDCVLDSGFCTDYFFRQENFGNQHWRFKSEEQFQYETGIQPQETRYIKLKRLDDLEQLMKTRTGHHSGQDLLVNLIKQMLHLDANQRITPLEVLQHPFFEPCLSQSSSRDLCIDMENTEDQSLALSQHPSQRITPLEVVQHIFLAPSLSQSSSRDHCIDMENTEGQSLVRSRQPSLWESKSQHSIDCSVQNPVGLPVQTPSNMSINTPSSLPSNLDIVEGTILGKCYKVEAFLGEGCFGFVTKCLNTQTNRAMAIKVNKSDPEILQQAKFEIFILKQLQCLDPDTCSIVKWNGFFFDRGRICLNFELLDQSLFDYIQDRNNQGLPISELRPILYQLANALSHLSSIGIVHTDLKPDNVMVVDRHQSPIKVKVIDFGLACPVSAVVPGVSVQALWYRAPEVMLQVPFNQAIDMWAVGLIAVELATGWPLYPGDTEFDVLRFIIHTQGQPPDCVLDSGFCTDYFFRQENFGNQRWRFKSEEQVQYETGIQPQETRYIKLKRLDDLEQFMKMRTGHHSGQDLLVNLIKQMLHLDANQRITPLEVLQHPFFEPCLSQSSSRDPCIDMENTEDQSLILSQQPSHRQSHGRHKIDYSIQNPAVYLNSALSSNNEECDIQFESTNQSWQFSSKSAVAYHACFCYPIHSHQICPNCPHCKTQYS